MKYEKYSVLMSLYFKEKPSFLKKSIESMINQSLEPDEIVIVKDGKLTEELDEVLDKYTTEYPNLFKIVALKKNLGLGLALNKGLEVCRNDLVARMDTDDISLKERCQLQVEEFMKNKSLSIVGSIVNEFYDTPENIVSSRVVPTRHEDIMKFARRRSPFNHPSVMYRKSAVIKCGGYRDIKRKEDIDLFVRMLNEDCIAMNIDKPLLLFRSNEDNFLRRKSWENCKSYIDVIYSFWKLGYSTTSDLIIVTIGQIVMFLSPVWVLKILSNRFLRKKGRDM
ncbi:glycosyltransferase [[Clostridium] sordellii]|uniref:glycosyltransferase n=1 Tax=Paraclostridium sordellii TaxID=1505 RepID=UPI0005E04264|nr:glycosyltransferase [Paeniclostridium sordellii]CEN91461.1 glycosyltransferase [[Clostridium] sordellii] [Paeniclostridium sordellii]